jgi:hypothetical protein
MRAGVDHPAAGEGLVVAHRWFRPARAAVVVATLLAPVGLAAPTSADTGAATAAPLIRVRSVAVHQGTGSTNWSGYGIPGSYSAVTASWTVPTVAATSGPTYSSTWIGVDGLANRNLIQTGTESDYVNGHAQYLAWWEVLPAPETVIRSLPVSPGDHMTASITRVAGRTWTVVLTDSTRGRSFTHTRNYRGTGASAEWIEERPQIGSSLSTLASYGSVTFTGLTANGADPHLTSTSAISMYDNQGTAVISTPSLPATSGDAFSVAYGPSAPPAPAG